MNMCNYFNAALTFLFTMEAALKLFAFKLVCYFDPNRPYRVLSFTQWPRFHVKHLLMFCA
jgi:hypothetical protein